MYTFFYSMYLALFTGNWWPFNTSQSKAALVAFGEKAGSFIISALGGEYTTLQEFTWNISYQGLDLTFQNHICALLALITMIGVCISVWKLTKMIFSIFFSRA